MSNFLIIIFISSLIYQKTLASVNISSYDNFKLLSNENLAFKFFEYLNNEEHKYMNKTGDAKDLECINQIQRIGTEIKIGKIWALEVIDSWGKIPAGILHGHMRELGNFEECMNIRVDLSTEKEFKGQYCTLNLPIKEIFEKLPFDQFERSGSAQGLLNQLFLQSGICVPYECSEEILNILIKDVLSQWKINIGNDTVLIKEKSCKNNDPYSKTAIFYVAVVLSIIFAVLMLLSTIFEYKILKSGDEQSYPLLTAFSIKSNGRRLFRIENYENSANVIQCLNGIRCFSIIMVIYGHEYGFAPQLNFINAIDVRNWEKSVFSLIIKNGTLAVDTFFVLSGCLMIWSAFKEMDKTQGKLNIPLMYFHRYIRLTPIVAMTIILSIGVYPHLGNGPFWDLAMYLPHCEKYWWSAILYVQNYVNPTEMCLPHTWYLAVDTQFYLFSPLLIIPMYKWGLIGLIPGILGSIGSIIYVFLTWMNKEFHWFLSERTIADDEREKLIYTTTHSRIPSYVTGIALGYFLFKLRKQPMKLSKRSVTIGWLTCFAIMAAILFGLYPKTLNLPNPSGMTTLEGALFESLSRTGWSLAVAWVIFACHLGYGGIINTLLSWGIWQPLARLCFSMYITHAIVVMLTIQITKTDIHFSDFDMMLRFWTTFGFTLLVSTIFTLAFELPILGIEKSIFSKKFKKNSK